MVPLLAALLSAFCLRASGEVAWNTQLKPALDEAARGRKLVLLDFQAPWCYSCYYMERHVLSTERFEQAVRPLVLVKLDVDQPEGHDLRERYAVTMLPAYVLIDSQGREKGRILGEQTENDFVDKVVALQQGSGQDDAALAALRAELKKGDAGALERLLDRPASCDMAYDVEDGEALLGKLDAARRAALLDSEKKALESLAARKLFVDADRRCADFRSGVDALADVYDALGRRDDKSKLVARAADLMQAQAATGDDRNRDDNLRYFLEELGDKDRVRRFYRELIAAYPSDYVYSYRYAKWLQENGDSQDALPWIEEADKLCYGANRLKVTLVRAKILADLGRKDEAKELLKRDAKAGRKSFPKDAVELDALRKTL